jgi:peptidyl-prolyl cis-trans isomerase B (cyclophilin B)
MKSFYRLCRLLLLLAMPAVLTAQTAGGDGKPLYRITADREGTPLGEIILELYPDIAPLHVRNFDSLVSIGFYNGTAFHRVIPGFVIQGGDPNSRSGPEDTWGFGDPGQQTVPAEFTPLSHRRGMLSAARSNDPNSATSQFFICHADALTLDGRYSVYGKVISGMDVVDTIALSPRNVNDRPLQKISMQVERIGLDTTSIGPTTALLPLDDTRHVPAGITVSWEPVPGAILYQVQLSRSSDFANDTIVLSAGTGVGLTRLVSGKVDYYWRVRATNGGKHGEFSETRSFTTSIAIPRLEAPLSNSTVTSTSAALRWKSVFGATGYRLQISPTFSFTSFLLDSTNIQDTTVVIHDLVPGTKYYWRVRALDDTASGSFSSGSSFTISATSAVERETFSSVSEMELVVGGADRATLRLTLRRDADMRLVISDLLGHDLAVIHDGRFTAGERSIPIDLSALAAGTYLLRLSSEHGSISRTFQVAR